MNSFNTNLASFLRVLVLLSCYLTVAKGLHCYECAYAVGDTSQLPEDFRNQIDESCMKASTPHSKFFQPCNLPVVAGKEATCRALHATGNFSVGIQELFIRKCENVLKALPLGCAPRTGELISVYQKLPDSIAKLLTPETKMLVCDCREKGCGPEMKEEVEESTTPSNEPAYSSSCKIGHKNSLVGLVTAYVVMMTTILM